MDEPEKPSEKVGKTVGHAVEVFVAWVTQMVLQGYGKLKESQLINAMITKAVSYFQTVLLSLLTAVQLQVTFKVMLAFMPTTRRFSTTAMWGRNASRGC